MLVLASKVAIRGPQLAGRACQFLLPPAHTKRAHGADMRSLAAITEYGKLAGLSPCS